MNPLALPEPLPERIEDLDPNEIALVVRHDDAVVCGRDRGNDRVESAARTARGPSFGHQRRPGKSRALVDAFYKAALAAGGRDNGPPGIRAHYHPDYYGAFVLDPDGHNVEVVCHYPPGGTAKRGAAKAKSAAATSAKKKTAKKPAKRAGAKRKKR